MCSCRLERGGRAELRRRNARTPGVYADRDRAARSAGVPHVTNARELAWLLPHAADTRLYAPPWRGYAAAGGDDVPPIRSDLPGRPPRPAASGAARRGRSTGRPAGRRGGRYLYACLGAVCKPKKRTDKKMAPTPRVRRPSRTPRPRRPAVAARQPSTRYDIRVRSNSVEIPRLRSCALTHPRGRGARAGQPRPLCAALGSSAQATARMPLKPPSTSASSSVSRCRLHSPPPPWPYS